VISSSTNNQAATVALNLRRLMARGGLTFEDVVQATELDERTLRGLVRGTTNPHARTLFKLAQGLGVEMDELFRQATRYAPRQFDRAANSLVKNVVDQHAETFANWSDADFDELYSRFGVGGPLTEEGVLAAAQAMNANRRVNEQVNVILESGEAKLLAEFVDMLYRRVTATSANSSTIAS